MRLDDYQIESFERDGLLFFPSLLSSEEVAVLQADLQEVLVQERPEILREKRSDRVRCAFAPHGYSEPFRRLMRHPRLVHPVRQLLGGDVYLHQYSINPKAPFRGEAWGWHQDYVTWRQENEMPEPLVINVGVYLDEVTEFNGPVFFLLGSHAKGRMDSTLDEKSSSYALHTLPDKAVSALAAEGSMYCPKGPAGSAWMFHCNIAHASNQNISPSRRALCTICYNRIDNRPTTFPRPDWEAHSDFTNVEPLGEDCLLELNAVE